MKNFKLFYFLTFLLFCTACADDDNMIVDMPEIQPLIGTASVFLNGQETTFHAYAMKTGDNNGVRLELDVKDESSSVDRNISFSNIPFAIGSVDSLFNYANPIMESRSYCYYTAANGDAIYAFYDLVEGLSNTHFEVTDIDPQTELMKGSFEITLAIEEGLNPNPDLMLEDTIRLTVGRFEAPIRN